MNRSECDIKMDLRQIQPKERNWSELNQWQESFFIIVMNFSVPHQKGISADRTCYTTEIARLNTT
jgi:hypothetical protein